MVLLVVLCSNTVTAQTCTGSPGAPIVNITFGSGIGTGLPLSNSTTGFTYALNCPGDGAYALVNNTNGCYSDWHTVTQDHTGDPNGLFMLVNASTLNRDFYVQQIDGLCAGTTYQFSAWMLNMVKTTAADPNVTFIIEKTDGTLISSFNSNIPKTATPAWQQYGFTFALPTGVSSVVIRLHNNAPGGLGSGLALDDITFRPMGPPITVSIQGVSGSATTVCQGSPALTIAANVGTCFPTTTYLWQVYRLDVISPAWADINTANGITYTVNATSAGAYQYRLLVANDGNLQSPGCRVISAPVSINITPAPQPVINIITAKTNICTGEQVLFTSFASGVGQGTPIYDWQVNGVSVNNNANRYITRNLKDGDAVTCTLISNLSCAAPAISPPITMHVSGVAPAITVTASANNVCAGTPVTFTVSTNQTTGITYQWQVNGVDAPSTGSTFVSTNLKNGNIVTCMVGSSTCSTPVSSDEILMKIIDAPSVNIAASVTTTCPNTPVTFKADQIPGASYQWQINGKPVGSNSSTFVAPQVNNGDVVNCLVLTSTACSAPIQTKDIIMQVSSSPTAVTVIAAPDTICQGTTVTFTATAGQTTGISYQWLVNGQTVTDTGNTLVKTDLKNGDIVACRASASGNCAPPIESNPVTVVVTDLPQITLAKSVYEIYKGESVTLGAAATGTGLTYQWSPATGLDKTDIAHPVGHPNQTTTYTLVVTNASGCMQTSMPVTVKVLIKDIIVPNSFTPNNDGINDKWEIAGLADDPYAQVQVFDRYGLTIYQSIGYKQSWNGRYKEKILPAGVYYYIIRLSSNTRKVTGYVTIIH
ncbi:hypothetical protein GCM10022392_05540 [Mucilaginibacter panaciglaebae]|uniref:Gliding motility-associated-like protein n=2 Tax=Mucilaginibacter panaciglaebae TaxID=502331 RepID=A0ABP7WEU6_9SPHI